MSFFKKLVKGVGKVAKSVGVAALSTVPIVGGIASKVLDNALSGNGKSVSQEIAEKPPTVANVVEDSSDYPKTSNTFPNGADPIQLNPVTITAPKVANTSPNPFNINLNLDTKNGKYSADVNNQQNPVNNNMLMFGLLGLGALVLLNKK